MTGSFSGLRGSLEPHASSIRAASGNFGLRRAVLGTLRTPKERRLQGSAGCLAPIHACTPSNAVQVSSNFPACPAKNLRGCFSHLDFATGVGVRTLLQAYARSCGIRVFFCIFFVGGGGGQPWLPLPCFWLEVWRPRQEDPGIFWAGSGNPQCRFQKGAAHRCTSPSEVWAGGRAGSATLDMLKE